MYIHWTNNSDGAASNSTQTLEMNITSLTWWYNSNLKLQQMGATLTISGSGLIHLVAWWNITDAVKIQF